MLRRAFVVASVGWAVSLPLASFAASRAHAAALPYGLALGVYVIGSRVCHQLPARSFHLWGASLPVCARCAGIYAGSAMAAIGTTVRLGERAKVGLKADTTDKVCPEPDPTGVRVAVVLALMPTAATLAYEWTTGVAPSNAVRALAGLPLGAVGAWIVCKVN